MRRPIERLASLTAAVVVAVLWANPVLAQPGPELDVTNVDVSAYPEVTATVGVPTSLSTDPLSPSAFRVVENGSERPVEVTPLPPEDLRVILAIDTSGSMTGVALQAAKAAAKRFLEATPADTQVSVLGFGTSAVVARPFSLDRLALSQAVDGLVARGRTSLYDALSLALDQFPPPSEARGAIVLLSDGADTASTATLDAVTTRLAQAQVRLEVAELVTAERGTDALARLADAGGGRVASADDPGALSEIYRSIAALLANQYRVNFPSNPGGPTELVFGVDHRGARAEHRLTLDLPRLPPAQTTAASGWPSGWALVIGLTAFFLALTFTGVVAFASPATADRLRLGATHPNWVRSSFLAVLARRLAGTVERLLSRFGRFSVLTAALDRAGVRMGPGEFVVLWGSVVFVAGLAGYQLSGLLLGLVFGLAAAYAVRLGLQRRTRRRQAAFADQLVDTLQLLAGSLRTGYALLQACDAVAKESDPPTSDEFSRVLLESRLGRELMESLEGMADRVGSQDFEWVVGAIEIHREVGGDLAEVLDNVSGTIRERDQVRRQIRTLSAEARISAYVLVALPFGVALVIQLVNPGYLSQLRFGGGRILVGLALGLMVAGSIWLKRLCRLVF